MLTRREALIAAACVAVAPTIPGCTSAADTVAASRSVRRTKSGFVAHPELVQRELVRYATLAPSSHNTQCWKFDLQPNAIAIHADLARRCPAVDPDDHHLFVSLGCALENLTQAAQASGLHCDQSDHAIDAGLIDVALTPTAPHASALYDAIPSRQCTRGEYDGQPLTVDELGQLQRAGSSKRVQMIVLTERAALERVLELVVAGNTTQMHDQAFLDELQHWIRFNAAEAVDTGDGLYAGIAGNPSLPRWLGQPLMRLFFTTDRENQRYARQIRSAAGVAVFVSAANDRAHWVETGRCYERFALQATALGIRNAMLNQPVEVAALRPELASWLGVGNLRPDLVVRFGRGATLPMSLRRPVEAVLL
ncbi:MAG: Tat pathway signal protein [Pseudomonadota bacterium]|nr:Tat pathway signal protein [Pseudomonadota bacterium]